MKNETQLLTDTNRSYKFITDIQYRFDHKSSNQYGYKSEKNIKNKVSSKDNLHDISHQIHTKTTSNQQDNHYLRNQNVTIKGNILTIDTFYQRIIVDNKEILSTDTVVISNPHLFNSILSWLGTKYKYGGNNKKNVDCSALMRALVHTTYNKYIPRTSIEQYKNTKSISKENLQEGDLIFFAIHRQKRVSHVGMFLSNDYFIHASTSSGVTLSSLKTPYWNSRIVGYGKYINTLSH